MTDSHHVSNPFGLTLRNRETPDLLIMKTRFLSNFTRHLIGFRNHISGKGPGRFRALAAACGDCQEESRTHNKQFAKHSQHFTLRIHSIDLCGIGVGTHRNRLLQCVHAPPPLQFDLAQHPERRPSQ